MSPFSIPSFPHSPHPYSDFDIATYLEAQRAGFSSSPPPESPAAMRQSRNDSGAYQLQSSPSSQSGTVQGKGKEPCRQQDTSSSMPASRIPLSSKDVPSRHGLEQEQRKGEGGQQATASSSRSSSPEITWETSPLMWVMSGRPPPPEAIMEPAETPASTAPGQTSTLIPGAPSTVPKRRSPDRTFTAPAVSWRTYRALSPFSFEGNGTELGNEDASSRAPPSVHADDDEGEDNEEFNRRFPTLPSRTSSPASSSAAAAALRTAQPIHLRSISGSSEISEIELARHTEQLPALTRCPPRHHHHHRSSQYPYPYASPLTYSQQRFDLTYPSPLFAELDFPAHPNSTSKSNSNASSTSLPSRAHTPSGSRFMEHVNADGEAMYSSQMRFVRSRSGVALERCGGEFRVCEAEDRVGVNVRRDEEDEMSVERGKKRGRGWRRVFCFH